MAVTEERKQQLRANYEANKDLYNKRKILQRLRTNKQYWVSERVINHWNWTAKELDEITEFNEKYRQEQTVPRRVIKPLKPVKERIIDKPIFDEPAVVRENQYTTGMAIDKFTTRLIHRKNKLVEPSEYTVEGNKQTLQNLVKLFDLQSNNLLDIVNKYTTQEIKDKIDSKKSWGASSRVKHYGLFGHLATLDERFFRLIGKKKADELNELWNTERQKLEIQTRKEKATQDVNFRDIYFKAKDRVNLFGDDKQEDHPDYGTMKYALALLYTRGMYDKTDDKKIIIVPRNYFHEVYLVKNDNAMNNDLNFYNTNTGYMVLNKFKTSDFYKFKYYVPTEVKKGIDAYLKQNGNKTFLFERKEGGKLKPSTLASYVKTSIGTNIQRYRVAIENFEIQVRKTPNEVLANAMAHSLTTQDSTYLRRVNYENTSKYLGRKVKVVIDTEGSPNFGKTLIGKVGLNDGKNKDFPIEEMNYSIVFDKRTKEPNEYLSLPDPSVQFVDEEPPATKSKPPPKKPTKSKRRSSKRK